MRLCSKAIDSLCYESFWTTIFILRPKLFEAIQWRFDCNLFQSYQQIYFITVLKLDIYLN